jgi:hypothetical protein
LLTPVAELPKTLKLESLPFQVRSRGTRLGLMACPKSPHNVINTPSKRDDRKKPYHDIKHKPAPKIAIRWFVIGLKVSVPKPHKWESLMAREADCPARTQHLQYGKDGRANHRCH